MTHPAILVLAAGQATRLHPSRHTLEQPWYRSTVLGTTVANALATALPVLVVTTARLAPLVAPLLALRDMLVLSDDEAGRGMGHSIAAGVAERSASAGWLVLPGDMPAVRPQTLLAVAAALAEHPVAYAQHGGRRGHPVAFAAELYSDLATLRGDDGARRLLARYPARAVDVDDPGVLLDADDDDDLDAQRAPRLRLARG